MSNSTQPVNIRGLFDAAPKLSPERIRQLRKHVVNLNMGRFSSDGSLSSSESTVAAIFKKHLREWIDDQADDRPTRVVLYAHGGLTNESWGLYTAAFQMNWWLANGVYPVFFVWETGLLETLWQIFVAGERRLPFKSTRGVVTDWFDELEDRAWEKAVRRLGAPVVWAGMKESARSTFGADGDGRVVLNHVKEIANDVGDRLEIHAVGHSAGSIFMAHALTTAKEQELPKFESMHLLAPAITCQSFQNTIKPLVGNGQRDALKQLTLFTMSDAYELEDTVGPYDKSLLYLIFHALEPDEQTPILGLERSLMEDDDMSRFFGLAGHRNNSRTDVVFSVSGDDSDPKSSSTSTTHGGFDNDPATMQSVLRRIISARSSSTVSPFPNDRGLEVASRLPSFDAPLTNSLYGLPEKPQIAAGHAAQLPSTAAPSSKALCIGIDDYRDQPLAGCVNDSNAWRRWLETHGFAVRQLTNEQATRAAIVELIRELFAGSREGDTIVIQFAGHGTQVEDLNGDELRGDTPGKDEALVPIDYHTNGLVLDDDLGELCRTIPDQVNVTFFMDCCHSGTNTRMFMSRPEPHVPNQRARFMRPTEQLLEAHRKSRPEPTPGMRSFGNQYNGNREILFAACQSGEVALETAGQGDFTRHAMTVASQNRSLTAEEFLFLVKQEFGPSARQTPGLWCDSSLRSSLLIGATAK